MAGIDILLLIPIVMGAFNGFKRGLLVEVIGIAAFILAIIFGFRFLGLGMEFISGFFGGQANGKWLPYLGFLLIFFPTIFAINKIGWLFRKALRITFLGTLDGLAGAVLGAFLWFFGLSVLLWLGSTVGIGIPDKYIGDSEVYPFLENFAPEVINRVSKFLPSAGEIYDQFNDLAEKANIV